jgi:sigma-B regulation protein RsbU (phosphoserine phosphatase)
VLAALNETFPMEEYGEKCFTMWYGVYQPSTSTLAWSGGGHPEALLFAGEPGSGSQPEKLESQGPMIGMMPWPEFESGQRQIASPARLYVYSDGVHEIHKTDGSEWTFDEFLEFLSEPSKSGNALMDDLLQHVRELHGSELLDDDFSMVELTF